jgi:putative DNA primase/helicase
LTAEDRHRLKTRIEADKKRRQEDQEKRQAEARHEVQRILVSTMPATADHAYLTRKSVAPVGGILIGDDGRLVLPILDATGAIQSLQFIAQDGGKLFLSGGKIKGGFFPIQAANGEKAGRLYICEGYATGATIHAATADAVLVAFNCGNLKAVAEMARDQYPDREIVICADDDAKTAGNPGLSKATEAALAVKAKLAVPKFTNQTGGTDFNDLAASGGMEVVKAALAAAEVPGPAEAHGAAEGGAPPRTEQCRPVGFDDCPPPPILPETLPGILRAFPQAVAEAIQVPYELALINALGAVAVAAQRKFKVVVKPGYAESINIYALCALPPGERKSSTVEACKRPLVEWQAAKRLEMRDAIRDAESERKTMEKAIEGRRNKAASCNDETRVDLIEEIKRMERELPEVPVSPRLLVDDATPEALASLLETQDERIGMLEAEGGFFDTLAGRYSSGVPNLDLILKAWGGEPAQVDRKGRDAIFLRNPHKTLVISPQPEIVQGMAAKPGFRGRGVVGRFLVLLPQSRLGGRDQDSTPVPATLAHSWSSTIFRLLDMPWATGPEGEKAAHGIGLTADALELWRRFASMVEAGLLPGGEFEYMTDWAGKFPGQAIRLAGLIHVATSPDPLAAINRETMASALGLAAILADHAKAAYGLMGSDPAQECAKAILRWLVRDQVATFTARDALRSVRGRFPTMDKVNPGLAILEERGFIFGNPSDTRSGPGRKPSAIYTVNPRTGEA